MRRNSYIIITTLMTLLLGASAHGGKQGTQGSDPSNRIPQNVDPFESLIVLKKRVPANQNTQGNVGQFPVNQLRSNDVVNIYNLPNRGSLHQQQEVRPVRGNHQILGGQSTTQVLTQADNKRDFSKKKEPHIDNSVTETLENKPNKEAIGGMNAPQNQFEGIDPFKSIIKPKPKVRAFGLNGGMSMNTRSTVEEPQQTFFTPLQNNSNLSIDTLPKAREEQASYPRTFKNPFEVPKLTINHPTQVTSIYELPPRKVDAPSNSATMQNVQMILDIVLRAINLMDYITIDLKNNLDSVVKNVRMLFRTLDGADSYPLRVDEFISAFKEFVESMSVIRKTDHTSAVTTTVKYEQEKFKKTVDKLDILSTETKTHCSKFNNSSIKADVCRSLTKSLSDLSSDLNKIKSQSKIFQSLGIGKVTMAYDIQDPNADFFKLQYIKKQIYTRLQLIVSPSNNLNAHLIKSKLNKPLNVLLEAVKAYTDSTASIPVAELIKAFLEKFDSSIVLIQSFRIESSSSMSKFLRISDSDKDNFVQFFNDFAREIARIGDMNFSKEGQNVQNTFKEIEQVVNSAFTCKHKNYNLELIEGENNCDKFNNASEANQSGTSNTERADKLIDYINKNAAKLESAVDNNITPFYKYFVDVLKSAAQVIKALPESIDNFSPVSKLIKSGFQFANTLTTHRNKLPERVISFTTYKIPEGQNFKEDLGLLITIANKFAMLPMKNEDVNSVSTFVQNLGNLNFWYDSLLNENGKLYELNDKVNVGFVLPQYVFSEENQKFTKAYPNKNTIFINNNETTLKKLIASLAPKTGQINITNFYKVTLPALQVLINFYNNGKYSDQDVAKVDDLVNSVYDVLNTIKTTQTRYIVGPNSKEVTKTTFDEDKVNNLLAKINNLRNAGKSQWNDDSTFNGEAPHVFEALDEIESFLTGLEKDNSGLFEYPNKEDKNFVNQHQQSILKKSTPVSSNVITPSNEDLDQNEIIQNDLLMTVPEHKVESLTPTQLGLNTVKPELNKRFYKARLVTDFNEEEESFPESPLSKDGDQDPLPQKDSNEPRKKPLGTFADDDDHNNISLPIEDSSVTDSVLEEKPLKNSEPQNYLVRTEKKSPSKSLSPQISQNSIDESGRSSLSNNHPKEEDELSNESSEILNKSSTVVNQPEDIEDAINEEEIHDDKSLKSNGSSIKTATFKQPLAQKLDESRDSSVDSLEHPMRSGDFDLSNSQHDISSFGQSSYHNSRKNVNPVTHKPEVDGVDGLRRHPSENLSMDDSIVSFGKVSPKSVHLSSKTLPNIPNEHNVSVISKKEDSLSESHDDSLLDSLEQIDTSPIVHRNRSQSFVEENVFSLDDSLDELNGKIANQSAVTTSGKSNIPKNVMNPSVNVSENFEPILDEIREESSPTWSQKMRDNNTPKVNSLTKSKINDSQNFIDLLDEINHSRISHRSNDPNINLISNDLPQNENEEDSDPLKNVKSVYEPSNSKSLNNSRISSTSQLSEYVESSIYPDEEEPQSVSNTNNINSLEMPSMITEFGREPLNPTINNLNEPTGNFFGKKIDSQPQVAGPKRKPIRKRVIVIIEQINCSACLDDQNIAFFVRNVLKIYK